MDDDVVHVEGRVDPVDDIETVNTELILADDALQAKLRAAVASADAVFLDATFESELVELAPDDAAEMLADSGQNSMALDTAMSARLAWGIPMLGMSSTAAGGACHGGPVW